MSDGANATERPVDPEVDQPSRVQRAAAGVVIALPALPVLLALIRQIRWGWVPTSDEATIAIQSFDQITTRASLLGEYTTSGDPAAGLTRNPGPLQFTLYALPHHAGPLWMAILLAALVSMACLCGAVALTRQQGGMALASMVSLGLLLVVRSVNPNYFVSTWNPGAGLAPFILLIFLCWVVGSGQVRWFPLMVLVASLAAQTHLTFLVGAVPAATVATAMGFGGWIWGARKADTRRFGTEARWFVGGMLVLVVCWLPVVIQQVTSSGPGNLRLLVKSGEASTERAGYFTAMRPMAQALGWPPRFIQPLRVPASSVYRYSEFTLAGRITAVALLVGLLGVGVLAVRRRDRVVTSGVVLVFALVAAGLSVAAATPTDVRFLVQLYTLLWLIPLGMVAWMVLGLGIVKSVRAFEPRLTVDRLSPRVAAVGVALTVAIGLAVVTNSPSYNIERGTYEQAHHLGDAAAAATQPGLLYRVDSSSFFDYGYRESMAYRVRRAGGEPVLKDPYGSIIGTHYQLRGDRCDGVFMVELAETGKRPPTQRGGRVLATTVVLSNGPDGGQPRLQETALVLRPDAGGPSC